MQQKTTILKRVRFSEAHNKQHEAVHDLEDFKTCWYQRDDYTGFSYEAHITALAVQFKKPNDNAKSYANILISVYMSCMKGTLPSMKAFQYYVHWNRICPERRGIERYCVRNMNKSMQSRTSDSNVTVLALQTQLVLERVPRQQRTEKIQSAYKKQAQSAHVFARIQGIADALANKEMATPQAVRKRTVPSDSSDLSIAPLSVKKRKFTQENCMDRSITPPSRQVVTE